MAFAITIRDEYGDPLNLEQYDFDPTRLFLEATEVGQTERGHAELALDRKGAKKLRKVLKRFLRESKGAGD